MQYSAFNQKFRGTLIKKKPRPVSELRFAYVKKEEDNLRCPLRRGRLPAPSHAADHRCGGA